MSEESRENSGDEEVKVPSGLSSSTSVDNRTAVRRRPRTVHNKRGIIKGRKRPSTVHSNTGLARERSKFLKAEKREQKIDEELTRKEKKEEDKPFRNSRRRPERELFMGMLKERFTVV